METNPILETKKLEFTDVKLNLYSSRSQNLQRYLSASKVHVLFITLYFTLL